VANVSITLTRSCCYIPRVWRHCVRPTLGSNLGAIHPEMEKFVRLPKQRLYESGRRCGCNIRSVRPSYVEQPVGKYLVKLRKCGLDRCIYSPRRAWRGKPTLLYQHFNGVQKKAAKFALHTNSPKWETLASRRKLSRICDLSKAYSGERACKPIGDRLQRPHYLSRVVHERKVRSRRQRTDIGKYSFVNRTIQHWN